MKNKKGFTLVELLAVIVILAIIALIATPIILNVIEDAKKSAAVDSAYGYIEAIEFNNAMAGVNDKYSMITSKDITEINPLVKVKGNKATSGEVIISEDGRVTSANICIGGYEVEYKNGKATAGPKCGSNSTDNDVVVKDPTIFDKAKSLVYTEDGQCRIDADSTDTTTYKYMGGCYIKGNSETNEATTKNYVWYNGFMWRIMGINEDKTVRLIVDENVTAIPYGSGSNDDALTYAKKEDYIHDWLNNEETGIFYKSLNNTKSIIKEGNYFCSETTNSTYLTEGRLICSSENKVTAKVGLITYDEYLLANKSYSYLNIGQNFWTMTPYNRSNVLFVLHTGGANISEVTYSRVVRPVINVEGTSIITEGEGTTSNYYVLSENKKQEYKNKELSDVVTSGEYVSLEGKTYRVVTKDSDGVKLILDGYYDTNVVYGDNNTFTTTSGIGATLNGDVLTWLGLNNSTKIKETAWYQGTTMSSGYTYKTPLTETEGNGISAKVGLIRVGEMLSGQSSTILTNNYTTSSRYSNANSYWTMNKYTSDSKAWSLSDYGGASNSGVTNARGVRPVIKVKNDLTISGGNGTWNNPYEI